MAKWGFDLTSFGTAEKFQALLKRHRLTRFHKEPHRVDRGDYHSKYVYFIWSGIGLKMITGNNPITGEFNEPGRRENEPGYASYIGIEGTASKVKALAEDIRKIAYIKDESPGKRDFI